MILFPGGYLNGLRWPRRVGRDWHADKNADDERDDKGQSGLQWDRNMAFAVESASENH